MINSEKSCDHTNGHVAIEDMAKNRFLFMCESCGHNFNLYKHEFSEQQLQWLDSYEERRCKFKFKEIQ